MSEPVEANDVTADDLGGTEPSTETSDYEELIDDVVDGEEEQQEEEGESEVPEAEIPSEETTDDEPDDEVPVLEGKPARIKEIKAKYPNIFKDFPELKASYFLHSQYAEVFPTVEEATEAAGNIEIMNQAVGQLRMGNPAPLIAAVVQEGKEAAENFADNLMSTLARISPEMMKRASMPIISKILNNAMKSENETLAKSARNLCFSLFGQKEVPVIQKTIDPEVHRQRAELEAERRELANTKYTEFNSNVMSRSLGVIKVDISKTLDPKKAMTPAVREMATEKILNLIDSTLKTDALHMGRMASLQRKAEKEGWPADVQVRITNAWLASARRVLPAIRSKVRGEIFGTNVQPGTKKQGKFIPSSPASQRAGVKIPTADEVDWTKTSEKDYLSGKNIHLKKK